MELELLLLLISFQFIRYERQKNPVLQPFFTIRMGQFTRPPLFRWVPTKQGRISFLFFMFSKLNCSITSNTVESKSSRAPKTLWRRVLSSFYKGTVGSKSSSSSARNFFRGLTWYIRVNWVLPIFIIILPSFSWCYRVLPGIRGI